MFFPYCYHAMPVKMQWQFKGLEDFRKQYCAATINDDVAAFVEYFKLVWFD